MSRLAAVDCHMVGAHVAGDAGNGRYAAGLARALAATAGPGETVAALVAQPGADALLGDLRTVPVPAGDIRRLAVGAPRALARVDADAAVFSYVAPPRSPCPTLLAVHDASFLTHPGWLDRRARAVLRGLVPASARRAGLVLVLSETARADVVAALALDPARVRTVSPYPDPAFTPDAAAAGRVAGRFGLRDYCLAVGDLGPRKNLEALGEAVALLHRPGLRLALVGRPGAGGARIAEAARARWLGWVDDATLADLYRAASVTAYPSRYEGFGLPVVEAMACASPVVASRRGAIPEVAGDAAILTEPEAEAIAEGLRAALEPAEADRLRAAGPARAAAYTPETTGRAGWAAIREVAS